MKHGQLSGIAWGGAGLIAAVLVATLVQSRFIISLLNYSLVYVILALGLQLIVGVTGQLSLGHAAFYGIGAYASAIATTRFGMPWVVGILLAMAFATLGSLLMSLTVRTRGIYFAVATLAFGIIIHLVFVNWVPVTRGTMGILGLERRLWGQWRIDSPQGYFLFLAFVVCAVYVFLARLTDSRFGRALKAIRENELAAQSIGIDVTRYKIKSILIGGATAGLAGSMMAHLTRMVTPEPFGWWKSIVLLIMIVAGGLGSLPGAAVGAFVLTLLSEYFRGYAEYSMLAYGLIIVFFMIYLPEGLAGLWHLIIQKVRRGGRRAVW